jgi:acyl dehydratase
MKTFHGLSAVEEAVGSHLGYSPWIPVTQRNIDLFAEATGDHQWIHVDPVKAATGPFGGTIAHGYLTLALLPFLVAHIYAIEGLSMGVNYGVDKVRFPAPLPVDSQVRAGVELTALVQRPSGHQLTARVTVEAEGGSKPVCVADTLSLLVPA